MDRVPELLEMLGKEAAALLVSIEERLSMLRASGISSEDLEELEKLVEEIQDFLRTS